MGFRTVFISEHTNGDFPQWFVDKWSGEINFYKGNKLPISSKTEGKMDNKYFRLPLDIQKSLKEMWDNPERKFVLILLHECDGITKLEIGVDSIISMHPESWGCSREYRVIHHYCDGCSDGEEWLEDE